MALTTTIQRLDKVLLYVADKDSRTEEQIKNGLKDLESEMSANELYMHLNQLVADGYIKLENGVYSTLTTGVKLVFEDVQFSLAFP